MIVLGYINNQTRRFKTFVGNRVAAIHDVTQPEQWRHVNTKSKPADIASRGIDASDRVSMNIWLNGPDFLSLDQSLWPESSKISELPEDDAEIKKDTTVLVTTTMTVDLLLCQYSSWNKLTRCVAWL